MTHRPLDPRTCPVAIDANALNRDGSDHDALVDRLLSFSQAGTISLILPKRVREEIQNPQTPLHIQDTALPQIFTIGTDLTADELLRNRIITQELQGNAKAGKHEADADHLFEAAKYAGYFITHDQRILRRSGRLGQVLPPSLSVVTLAEFLSILNEWEARYPRCSSN